MNISPDIGRLAGSLVGTTTLFAISSMAAGDFLPLLYFLGLIGIALLVIILIVGGGWLGVKLHAFLTGRYFDMAFSKVVNNTEVLPMPQDPYANHT